MEAEPSPPAVGIMKDEIVRSGLPAACLLPVALSSAHDGSAPGPSGRMTITQLSGRVDAMAGQEQALGMSRRIEALESSLKSKATAGLFLPWHKILQLMEAAGIRPRSYLQVYMHIP